MFDEILTFLSAGSFVYLALKIKTSYGNPIYFSLVLVALTLGVILHYGRGK